MEWKPIKNFTNTNLIYEINERIKNSKNKSDFTIFNELAAELIIGEERFDDCCIIDGSGDGGVDFYFIDEGSIHYFEVFNKIK